MGKNFPQSGTDRKTRADDKKASVVRTPGSRAPESEYEEEDRETGARNTPRRRAHSDSRAGPSARGGRRYLGAGRPGRSEEGGEGSDQGEDTGEPDHGDPRFAYTDDLLGTESFALFWSLAQQEDGSPPPSYIWNREAMKDQVRFLTSCELDPHEVVLMSEREVALFYGRGRADEGLSLSMAQQISADLQGGARLNGRVMVCTCLEVPVRKARARVKKMKAADRNARRRTNRNPSSGRHQRDYHCRASRERRHRGNRNQSSAPEGERTPTQSDYDEEMSLDGEESGENSSLSGPDERGERRPPRAPGSESSDDGMTDNGHQLHRHKKRSRSRDRRESRRDHRRNRRRDRRARRHGAGGGGDDGDDGDSGDGDSDAASATTGFATTGYGSATTYRSHSTQGRHRNSWKKKRPSINVFKDSKEEGAVTYTTWLSDVKLLQRKKKKGQDITMDIYESLKGPPGETVRALGPDATAEQMIRAVTEWYGPTGDFGALIARIAAVTQNEGETVASFAARLTRKVGSIRRRFPNDLSEESCE